MNIRKSLSLSIALGLVATACATQVGDNTESSSGETELTTSTFTWIAPGAGSVLPAQSAVTLDWTGGNTAWNVNLRIIDVAAFTVVGTVASNVPNNGIRTWTFPASLPCNRNYQFYVENTPRTTWAYGPSFKLACGTSVIPVPTPAPTGACTSGVAVSNLHYPTQTCAQTQASFLASMMTMYHFTSTCPAGTHLLGVMDVTCQNAPIPGFSTGSVYAGVSCCGVRLSPYYFTRDSYNAIWTVAQVQVYARNRANSECVTKYGAGSVAQDVIVTNVSWNTTLHETYDDRKFNCVIP